MRVPEELEPHLQGASVDAIAQVSSGLDGPVGETWLVVVAGKLRVFSRSSMFSEFAEAALDSAHPPQLEPGDFADTLHLAVADGSSHEVNVTSFERKAVRDALALCESATPPPAPEPEFQPAPEVADHDDEYGDVEPPSQSIAPDTSAEVTDDREVFRNNGHHDAIREKGIQKALLKDVYSGNSYGLEGCLVLAIGFFLPIAVLWFGYDLYRDRVDAYLIAQGLSEAFVFEDFIILARVVIVIIGLFFAVQILRIAGMFMRAANWGGRVSFEGSKLVVAGRRKSWETTIRFTEPFRMRFIFQAPSTTNETKSPGLILEQGNQVALIRTFGRPFVQMDAEDLLWIDIKEPAKDQKFVSLNTNDFNAVARRLYHDPSAVHDWPKRPDSA